MQIRQIKIFIIFIFFFIFLFKTANGEIIKVINITGNERISNETIEMFSSVNLNDNLDPDKINNILNSLYKTNFFENINIDFTNNILNINVVENPIIENIIFEGIKADRIKKALSQNLSLKSRSSFNELSLRNDKETIIKVLKELGFYFPKVEIYRENLSDNKISLTYKVDIGNKSKINKITFLGNKIFKDKKLKSLIVSEEFKFWKFISNKKFLNENNILLDKKLLKNFYLSKGYYNVSINDSFAKVSEKNQFELIYNIDPKEKIYFNNINLNLPSDFDEKNFDKLKKIFLKMKDQPYSIKLIEKILDEIDVITTNEEYQSITSTVEENLTDNKIDLNFNIMETEKMFVERINIFGNNITGENVIRNNFEIDEGDPYNEILLNKSINNLKSLNYFKKVIANTVPGKSEKSKIINISVEEKATGEISAGAGVGTSGGTIAFSVKENNYLGKGIAVEANATINEESIKGIFSLENPNFQNTDKSINFSVQSLEIDRMSDFGYKNNKTGFSIGTDFEYLDDFNLGLSTTSFYEKIETDSTASAKQKKQEGNYWDTFILLNFDYDKRDQKFQTSDGFRSQYFVNMPIISETNTLTNTYDYKYYTELYENNVSTASILLKTSHSLTNDDIKLSERLFIPSNRLRGFEKGKVGPIDGNDYIGGNYISAINFTSSLPQILENVQNVDFAVFFDAASVWGVDYDSSLDKNNGIRSSIGIGIDWFTVLGPLTFSLAHPLTKNNNDKTESFRFNLGTTF
jgi:outer membrane protein insertion porin family